eukprot:2630339-Prorocentrum_lima.AAC.1
MIRLPSGLAFRATKKVVKQSGCSLRPPQASGQAQQTRGKGGGQGGKNGGRRGGGRGGGAARRAAA